MTSTSSAIDGITPGSVHLWMTVLRRSPPELTALWSTLAADEQARAGRFRFSRDRDRYVVGRGWLRAVLARYLDTTAAAIAFRYQEYGKPVVVSARPLAFNLAHSEDQAILAVSGDTDVGVDVEWVRPGFAQEEIAERFFAPREVRHLRQLPPAHQEAAFFQCWTRKEAFLKALGGGLSVPLDAFEVEFGLEGTPRLLRCDLPGCVCSEWILRDLSDLTPAHVSALAVRADACAVVVRSGSGQEGNVG